MIYLRPTRKPQRRVGFGFLFVELKIYDDGARERERACELTLVGAQCEIKRCRPIFII